MYVNYTYYSNDYGGTMPEDAFTDAGRKSEAYIRYLTFLNGDVFGNDSIPVKQAVCAVADVYYTDTAVRAKQALEGKTGTVKSENNDGYSVSYVTEQTDGQTAETLLRKKAYDAAYMYLLPTGWLSRKVGCRHDHKCGYHDL